MTTHTHTLYVSGMHCASCEHLITDVLTETGLRKVRVSRAREQVSFESADESPAHVVERLNPLLASHGYALHEEQQLAKTASSEWLVSVPLATLFVLGFLLLDRLGLTSLIGSSEATLVTALLVGLVASVSTCLAVVGALVLSVSATYAHEGKGVRPQLYFHIGRLVGFFILGGILGLVGEAVQPSLFGSAILGAMVSVVMILLGIQLLDLTKRVGVPTLPKAISRALLGSASSTGSFAPLAVGALTFFLPCGFTQSMQIVALSTQSAVAGALIMFVFALGTLPVLALLSFGSFDLAKSRFRGVFFKTAGMLVILFALFNLQNALATFGIIRPLVSF